MKKIVSIISAAAMSAVTMAFVAASLPAGAEGTDRTVKIMCIGDSITDGYGVAGSYRKFIYHELTKKGYDIDMVGTKSGSVIAEYTDEESGETFSYDDGNTGYSGYAIKEYNLAGNGTSYGRNGILEVLKETNCLAEEQPDIVTIQIGTNDIIDGFELDKAYDRIKELLTYVTDQVPPASKVIVTTIPQVDPNRPEVRDWFSNYRHSADWQTEYSDEEAEASIRAAVDAYNETIRRYVNDRIEFLSKGQLNRPVAPLYLAEADSAITDVKTQLMDGVHPNNAGYKALGLYWADFIDEMVDSISQEPTYPPFEDPTSQWHTVAPKEAATAEDITITGLPETEPATEEATAAEKDDSLKIGDMVKVSRWLLGYPQAEITEADLPRYDLDKSGAIDVFDLTLMRKELLETCENVAARFKEKTGEDLELFKDGVDILIVDPNAETTEKVVSSSSGSHSHYVAVNTELIEFDTEEEAREWLEQHGFDPAVHFPEDTENDIIS